MEKKQQADSQDPNIQTTSTAESKRIVFIRHGRSCMNDLIDGVHYGKPGFTDVFEDPENKQKYHDSPLSPTGVKEVEELHCRVRDWSLQIQSKQKATNLALDNEKKVVTKCDTCCCHSFLENLELVVVSPLTRALQTMEHGLYKPLQQHYKEKKDIPVMALPLATERVYLVSDLGKPRSQLRQQYLYVDFDSGFQEDYGDDDDASWHYIPTREEMENYVEWRPHGEGQVYACLGEPQHRFDERMTRLYQWLADRPEQTIAVVCHAGVIDWMTQEVFNNCEVRTVTLPQLKPRGLIVPQLSSYS